MRELNSKTAPKTVRPERIIQFGEGNFLRAFVDWIISNMNERSDFNGSVVVVQLSKKHGGSAQSAGRPLPCQSARA